MSALVLALLLVADDAPATMDPAAIPNYTRVRPGLAVAGKPTPAALAHLKQQGFKTVIDLRMPTEGLEEEKASVEGQGLTELAEGVVGASLMRARDAEPDMGAGIVRPAADGLRPGVRRFVGSPEAIEGHRARERNGGT